MKCLYNLFKIIKQVRFKKIVVGGWDLIEFWVTIFIISKYKNCLALESGVEDSNYLGHKGIIKSFFLKRISIVFASGESHNELLKKLFYKGLVKITNGVGIINKPQSKVIKDDTFNGKFLYIGRLSPEKNIQMIIETFNTLPQFNLQIVGSGPIESILKNIASNNIFFSNHIPNEKINAVYENNDVFILPSKSEPWGLVVEEALYYGLPVLISSKVGCGLNLIKNKGNGIIFDGSSRTSFINAVFEISNNYENFRHNVSRLDINQKDMEQINSYIEALK